MITLMHILTIVRTLVLVSVSLVIHEWAHVFAIRYMGGRVEKVSFFPLGMMARPRRLERLHYWERYVIFAAGSMVNGFIALWAQLTSHLSYVGVAWLDELAMINIVFAIFNLIPVLPLDGGRIALQFLGNRMGILRATRLMLRFGRYMSWLIIALGFIQITLFPPNITLLLAGELIRRKNKSITPEMQVDFFRAMSGKNHPLRVRTLPVKVIKVPGKMKIKHGMGHIPGDYFAEFQLDGKRQCFITERALLGHVFTHGLNGTMEDVYKSCVKEIKLIS